MSQTLTERAARTFVGNRDQRRAAFDAWADGRQIPAEQRDDAFEADQEWKRERYEFAVQRHIQAIPALYQDAVLDALGHDQHRPELERWLHNPEARTLFLVGPPGTGKTFAAYALAAEHVILQGSGEARVWSVPGLLDALRPSAPEPERTWEKAKAVALLVLDDLAAAKPSDWATERMWMLADARTAANLRTVVTTNSPWPDLVAVWGEPTMDRLRDRCVVLQFAGASRRQPTPAW